MSTLIFQSKEEPFHPELGLVRPDALPAVKSGCLAVRRLIRHPRHKLLESLLLESPFGYQVVHASIDRFWD